MEDIKIKPLTKEQIIISIDRLTRFKNTEVKYLRVFSDILTHNLITPKYKKSELESMDYEVLRDLATEVINSSLNNNVKPDYSINQKLLEYEKSVFEFNNNVEKLLDNKINYSACLEFIDENSVYNLRWLKELAFNTDITAVRREKSLRLPLELVVIAEGATEEILLPKFSSLCGFDFDKEGVIVLSAGGKNQVVKLYYELAQTLKIPIFVLLDKDGMQNLEEIKPRLRTLDKVHLLECGEFEDLLPFELVKRTLQYEFENISLLEDFKDLSPRVAYLEEVFRTRGRHEFRKVDFAQSVCKNIQGICDISPEVRNIVDEIKELIK